MPDLWLADGDRVPVGDRVLEAVETPGHTRGHLVFDSGPGPDGAGASRACSSPVTTCCRTSRRRSGSSPPPGPGPSPASSPRSPGSANAPTGACCLRTVRWRPSVHARVDELLDHHAGRLDAIERVVASGASTGADAAAVLTWTRREKGLGDLEPFHRMLAVLETDAHLEVLAAQGRVLREADADGTHRHRPA